MDQKCSQPGTKTCMESQVQCKKIQIFMYSIYIDGLNLSLPIVS